MIGSVYSRLTVVSIAGRNSSGKQKYVCQCSCGHTKEVNGADLKNGNTRSCGCIRAELNKQKNTTHGLYRVPENKIWVSMKARCHNPRAPEYRNYGGRGIVVCQEWRDSFASFLRDMGNRPSPKHELDRIDNSNGYFKENCRWVFRIINARNRRDNKIISYGGKTMCLSAITECFGANYRLVQGRLRLGWAVEDAFEKPKYHRRPSLE